MQSFINKAVNNFFQDNLAFENRTAQSEDLAFMHVSKISLSDSSKDELFYVMVHDKLAKDIAYAMLFDENPDDETIVDLVNETANLIIGNLKLQLSHESNGADLRLSTPKYLGFIDARENNEEYLNSYNFSINSYPLTIGHISKIIA